MFNNSVVRNEAVANVQVLFIIGGRIFNGAVVDYIEPWDVRDIGSNSKQSDWGLRIVLHHMNDVLLREVSLNDIKVVSLINGVEIKLPL